MVAGVLGIYTSSLAGRQLFIRLLLIFLATLFALVNWGAAQRRQSAWAERRHHPDGRVAGRHGLEPAEAYDLLARSARTLYAANVTAPSTAARASR